MARVDLIGSHLLATHVTGCSFNRHSLDRKEVCRSSTQVRISIRDVIKTPLVATGRKNQKLFKCLAQVQSK